MNLFIIISKLFVAKHESRDIECDNVVLSMARSKALYKKLSVLVHPDRNPDNRELAESLMQLINKNKYNYVELKKIEKKIINELLNK